MMNDIVSLESLSQRGRTPLFNELVSVIQNTLDALSELPKTSNAIVYKVLKEKQFDKQVCQIVKDYTGITVSKLTIVQSVDPNAMATLDFTKKNWKTLNKGLETTGSIMEKINAVYDDRNAFLYEIKLTEDIPVVFALYVHTAFWNIKKDDGVYFFTAEEIAAIILHEIGHFDHFIRSFGRIYHRNLDASDIVNYVRRDTDPQVILNLLQKIKSHKSLGRDWTKIIDVLEKYFSTQDPKYSQSHTESINALCVIIEADCSARDVADVNLLSMYGFNSPDLLPSNKLHTSVSGVDAERSADEFSARNGSYAYLVSAIDKLYGMMDRYSYLHIRQFFWIAPAVALSLFLKTMSVINFSLEIKAMGYDSLIRRLELVSETAKHAFSDHNLTDDIKGELKRQIKEAEEVIAEYKSSKSRIARVTLFKWISSVGKLSRIVAAPFISRTASNYEVLQDATRGLTRNPLYYIAKT